MGKMTYSDCFDLFLSCDFCVLRLVIFGDVIGSLYVHVDLSYYKNDSRHKYDNHILLLKIKDSTVLGTLG